jgi:hypothetical protein
MPTCLRVTRVVISMLTTSFLLCLVVVLWLSACTVTQTSTPLRPTRRPPGAIFGKVFAKLDDPAHNPFALAHLPIALHAVGENQSDEIVDIVNTSGLGDYEFVDLQPGLYRVCWEQDGWISDCSEVFAVGDDYTYPPDAYVAPVVQQAPDGTIRQGILWGYVSITTTGDSLIAPSYRSVGVTLTNKSGVPLVTSVRVNSYGEWIATNVPISANFVIAQVANVTTTVEVDPSPALRRGQIPLTLTLRLPPSALGESSLIDQVQNSDLTSSDQEQPPDCQTSRWSKMDRPDAHSMLSATNWVGEGSGLGATYYYTNVVDPAPYRRTTLKEWWGVNGFDNKGAPLSGPHVITAQLSYLNTMVLGVGRNMNCRWDQEHGNVACYVSNYSERDCPDVAAQNLNPESANWAAKRVYSHLINTVAMEYAPVEGHPERGWIVKFFAFDRSGVRFKQLSLGGNAVSNYVPNLCLYCHGGRYRYKDSEAAILPTEVELRPSFREFDGRTFVFPGGRGINAATPEELRNLKQLNQIVLATDPRTAISQIIQDWYPSTETIKPDENYIPTQWKRSCGSDSIDPLQDQEKLYGLVVNPTCRICHIAFGMSFSSYDEFRRRKYQVYQEVYNNGSSLMPHSIIPYLRFWSGENSPEDFLAGFNGPHWDGSLEPCP